jgi:allantoin racemase
VKICVVIPVLYSDELISKARDEYARAAAPGTELMFTALDVGTYTIESEYDVVLNQPATLRAVQKAEAAGSQAAILACFGDPAGAAAKEASSIPVVGEGEAALHYASLLANKFSIITVREQTIPFMFNATRKAGLDSKLASVRAVDFGVLDLSLDCIDDVVAQAVKAIRHDGAEAIAMGCTGVGVDMCLTVADRLQAEIGSYIPIIDPVKAAIGLAESLVRSGYRQSERTYPKPPSSRPEYRWHDSETVVTTKT